MTGWFSICILLSLNSSLWAQTVRINEIQSSNASTITDQDGDYSDWIELRNSGFTGINLTGWGLSDDPDEPFKWVFPRILIQPRDYLLIFASGKNRTTVPGELHANFQLRQGGEYLALTYWENGAAAPVDEYAPGFPPQTTDVSYGVLPGGTVRFFNVPTPRGPNDAAAATRTIS